MLTPVVYTDNVFYGGSLKLLRSHQKVSKRGWVNGQNQPWKIVNWNQLKDCIVV